jgi:hypothetical protein
VPVSVRELASKSVSEPEHQAHPEPNQSRILPRPGACNQDAGGA